MNRFHMVILPKRGRRLLVTEENQHLAPSSGLDVHVGWLVFSRRGVHINAESTFLVNFHHAER
jgi:hypothetical protein